MSVWRKIVTTIYLLASVVVLGGTTLLVFIPEYSDRMAELFDYYAFCVFFAVCLGILVLADVILLFYMLFKKPEPKCVHPGGNEEIQVTLKALESVVRNSAPEDDVMIESIRIKVKGRDQGTARIRIEAIPLTNHGLEQMGERIKERVTTACEDMLGTEGVEVRVRFLSSKTETIIKEASGE